MVSGKSYPERLSEFKLEKNYHICVYFFNSKCNLATEMPKLIRTLRTILPTFYTKISNIYIKYTKVLEK